MNIGNLFTKQNLAKSLYWAMVIGFWCLGIFGVGQVLCLMWGDELMKSLILFALSVIGILVGAFALIFGVSSLFEWAKNNK